MTENNIERIKAQTYSPSRFSLSNVVPFFLIAVLYLLWVRYGLNELRRDHFVLVIGLTLIFFVHETGKKLVLAYIFLILYWMLFDSVRIFPNYEYMPIHIGDLYLAELKWFGITTKEGLITANEYFGQHNNTFLDIYSAFIYICWIPVPFIFGMYLFFSKRRVGIVHFYFAFLMVSIMGLIFQYLYPAAAPWYVELYGIEGGFQKVPGNPGRLVNFDTYFGVDLFSNMYSLNANVYAAVPSKHCAFPIISLFFAIKYKLRVWTVLFTILMLSTWFSAVYTNHHYIIDVICGIITALLTIAVYKLLLKTKLKTFLDNYGNRLL